MANAGHELKISIDVSDLVATLRQIADAFTAAAERLEAGREAPS